MSVFIQISPFGRTLVNSADAAAARTVLQLGSAATQNSSAFDAAGAASAALISANAYTDANATKLSIVPNTIPTAGQILIGNAGGTAYAPISMSGDVTISSAGVTSLKNTGTAGTYGDASHTLTITTDAQGRVTAVTTNAISSGLTVGTTTITGGTSTRVLYDNTGVVGESANLTFDGTSLTTLHLLSTDLYCSGGTNYSGRFDNKPVRIGTSGADSFQVWYDIQRDGNGNLVFWGKQINQEGYFVFVANKSNGDTSGVGPTRMGVGTLTPTATLHVFPNSSSTTVGVFQGAAARTAPLVQLQTSAGAVIGNVGGTVHVDYTDAGNTHTDGTFDDLYSYTLPANFFQNNGDWLRLQLSVKNVSGTVEWKLVLFGTVVGDTGTYSFPQTTVARVTIVRDSSTSVRYQLDGIFGTLYGTLTGLTLTGTNIVKCMGAASGVGAAAGSITAVMQVIERGESA